MAATQQLILSAWGIPSTALCIWLCLRAAVSEHKTFKHSARSTYSRPSSSLLSSPTSPHGDSPSVVGGIMGYCQAEPISCPLWQWQHRTDTAKDNIAANVTKLSVSCADSSALLPRGTAGGNRSLSSFLDAAVGAMNVAEMLNLLQSCWSSVAQPWHWVMPFHLRDIAGIAIRWMRLRVVFSSVITLLHSNSPLTPQMVHKWCLHTCWNSWTLFPKICSAGRYLPQLSGAVSISLEIF